MANIRYQSSFEPPQVEEVVKSRRCKYSGCRLMVLISDWFY